MKYRIVEERIERISASTFYVEEKVKFLFFEFWIRDNGRFFFSLEDAERRVYMIQKPKKIIHNIDLKG